MHTTEASRERRRHHRRTVIWKAMLSISWHDLSLDSALNSGSDSESSFGQTHKQSSIQSLPNLQQPPQHMWDNYVCWVRNLSTRGMLLQSEVCLTPHMAVAVTLPTYGRFDAFVAWSCGVLHGIAFVEAPDYILARFGEDAMHFGMTLHPEETFS